VVGKEDRIPTIGLVFRPDDPPPDLKVPQPPFSFFDIGLQGMGRVFVFLVAKVKILSQALCKPLDLSMKDFFCKEAVQIPKEFVFPIEITAVDQTGFDM
jgi:hypothetical protein